MGKGIFCVNSRLQISYLLGIYATVSQVEIYVIISTCSELLKRDTEQKRIYVFSDIAQGEVGQVRKYNKIGGTKNFEYAIMNKVFPSLHLYTDNTRTTFAAMVALHFKALIKVCS